MEKNHPFIPGKSSSFSCREVKKVWEPTRHLSMSSIDFDMNYGNIHKDEDKNHQAKIEEESKEDEGGSNGGGNGDKREVDDDDLNQDLTSILEEIDEFLDVINNVIDGKDGKDPIEDNATNLPEIPARAVDKLATLMEKEIIRQETGGEGRAPLSYQDGGEFSLLEVIDRVLKLMAALEAFLPTPACIDKVTRISGVLHKAMVFLEEEFRSMLEDSNGDPNACKNTLPTDDSTKEPDHAASPKSQPDSATSAVDDPPPAVYRPEVVGRLQRVACIMISGGYINECCRDFDIVRCSVLESELIEYNFEKKSIEDIQKMPWESLEGEVIAWITTFRQFASASFSRERELSDTIFYGHPMIASNIFINLTRGVVTQLLNFVEAFAMTKRSSEKLFKFLDVYETLRDYIPVMDTLFPMSKDEEDKPPLPFPMGELKSELSVVKSRLGDTVVGIFSDLESSIKSDAGKTPVPGGAVHPLTRYIMNYVKYTCEYKNTLEKVFQEHRKAESSSPQSSPRSPYGGDKNDTPTKKDNDKKNHDNNIDSHDSPFGTQLTAIMNLLDGNLESKSKLYKDPSLSCIFLMNNGRYMMQKIKGSAEINELLGNTWCRKRSADLRQYHKSYQRETWGKVLGCFKDEGLQVKGAVLKPVLKERFKSFNAMIEEIHRTQSGWVVSDDQLQSELRVSVSAVVVPAYRSFLGRFQHYLDSGRQTEKYIKFGPEDLETYIEELFDGNPSSMVRRRT